MKFSDENLQLAYNDMKSAQQRLDEVRARVEPRMAARRIQMEELRKAKEFCLMMAMLFTAAPMLIMAVIGLYRIWVGE